MTIVRKEVTFRYDCAYTLDAGDQGDTNKLFGLAFLEWYRLIWLWISWPVFAILARDRHHRDSVRVGWRYDNNKKKIILSAYCYVEGQRIIRYVCECYPGRPLDIFLSVQPGFYEITVLQHENGYPLGRVSIPYWHSKTFTYPLGLYFGGNQAAPHSMKIEIKKL